MPRKPGRLRLLYEANPMALLIEQAGGPRSHRARSRCSTWSPTTLHQRVPVILGSRDEVERIERYHAEHDSGTDQPSPRRCSTSARCSAAPKPELSSRTAMSDTTPHHRHHRLVAAPAPPR